METIEPKIIQTQEGFYVIDSDSHISKWCIENKSLAHDLHLIPLALEHIEKGSYVIDAGANIGSHSYAYSKKIGPTGGMLVAVEPGKLTCECLKKNVELFDCKNTYVLQSALSEANGLNVSHIPNASGNVGASRCLNITEKDRIPGDSYILTTTLDFIRDQMLVGNPTKKVSFVKLDIEGFEFKALLGGSMKLLPIDRPIMLIEINETALAAQGDKAQDIFDLLIYHNYEWSICQPEATILSPQYDILAIPKKKEE